MAWTKQLPSGKYIGKYRDNLGTEQTATGGPFTHRPAAKRAAEEQESKARRRGWSTDHSVTWSEWVEQWEPVRSVEGSTRKTDQERLRKHINPYWGKAKLSTISPMDVQKWVALLLSGEAKSTSKPLKHTTVKRLLTVFSAALTDAARTGIISQNPASLAKVGGGEEEVERYLTREEVAAVSALMVADRAVPFRALMYTGMRWGELVALDQSQVDWDRGVIRVSRAWERTTNTIKPYTKGKKARTVPVPSHVLSQWTRGKYGEPVFKSSRGTQLWAASFRREMEAATREAGVEPFRIHDARHTFASWLIQAGVPLAEVGRLLGHESAQTTERYAHLADLNHDKILSALG